LMPQTQLGTGSSSMWVQFRICGYLALPTRGWFEHRALC